MNNKNLFMQLDDKYIKELIILKLKRYYEFVKGEEYKNSFINLTITYGYSDFIEMLSRIALEKVVERISEISEQGKVRILFNEEVKINNKKGDLLKICDVILFTNETVEVIRIVPMELDIINVNNDDESMILGIGVIDKFATQMDCKYINLTVIQPNLITTSIYETSINKFLHEYDFSLIWS